MHLKPVILISLISFVATPAISSPDNQYYNLVSSNKLRRELTRTNLLKHAAKLQEFANADPDKNRAFGGKGHQLTVDYIYNIFKKCSEYYTVEKQEFTHEYSYGNVSFFVEGEKYDGSYFTYSPGTNGSLKAELVDTFNLGCNETDYPETVKDKIALVSRGTCEFGLKSVLAAKAGAKAIVIYNNIPGSLQGGTYGSPVRSIGPYVPGIFITQEVGKMLKEDVRASPVFVGLTVDAVMENRTTHNIIAQTKLGNQENVIVVGGHTDSVGAGPGINDDGSGIIAILEVALQLKHQNFYLNNAIRFCFWSAEEFGLVGSEYYIDHLSTNELNKINLYLNFDMIASPNFVYFVYAPNITSNATTTNTSTPIGSVEIQQMFIHHMRDVGWETYPTPFDGRSDYGPFISVGIPSGGLFTGAEGIKTKEQEAYYGGKAGVAFDSNYHKSGDTIKNLNMGAFITNTKAIAHAVATYGKSTESIPRRGKRNRVQRRVPREFKNYNRHSHCGHEDLVM